VAHNATTNIVRNLTVEAWVKVDRFADSGTAQVLYKGTGGTSWDARQYALWVDSDGSVTFATSQDWNQLPVTVTSAAGLVRVDEWHHLAAVVNRDQAGGAQAFVYVDGVFQAASGLWNNNGNAGATGNALLIGRTLEAQGNFEGTIDEVRIWNVARTSPQIAAARDTELLGSESGLMVY